MKTIEQLAEEANNIKTDQDLTLKNIAYDVAPILDKNVTEQDVSRALNLKSGHGSAIIILMAMIELYTDRNLVKQGNKPVAFYQFERLPETA